LSQITKGVKNDDNGLDQKFGVRNSSCIAYVTEIVDEKMKGHTWLLMTPFASLLWRVLLSLLYSLMPVLLSSVPGLIASISSFRLAIFCFILVMNSLMPPLLSNYMRLNGWGLCGGPIVWVE